MRPTRLLWALALSLLIHLGAVLGLRGLGFGPRPLPPLFVELVTPVVVQPTPEPPAAEKTSSPPAPPRRPSHRPRAAPPAAPPAGVREAPATPKTPAEARGSTDRGSPARPLDPEPRLASSGTTPAATAPAPPAEPLTTPRPSSTSPDRLVAFAPLHEAVEPPPAPTGTLSPALEARGSPSVPPPAPSRLTAATQGGEPRGAVAVPPAPQAAPSPLRGDGVGEPGEGLAGWGGTSDRPAGPSQGATGGGTGPESRDLLASLPGGSREAGGTPPEYRAYLEAFRRKVQESLVYPGAALRRRLEGTVRLEVRLRETGDVAGVGLLHSSGHAILDEAAVRTVEAAGPFAFPAGLRPRPLTIHLPIVFELR